MKTSKAYFEQIIREECETVLLEGTLPGFRPLAKKAKRGMTQEEYEESLEAETLAAWRTLKAEYPAKTLRILAARRLHGGAKKSQHKKGKALDVFIPKEGKGEDGMEWRKNFVGAAQRAGFTSFGFGRYTIHIDTRTSPGWWTYDDKGREINRNTKPNKFHEIWRDRVPEEFRRTSQDFLGITGFEVKRNLNDPPWLGDRRRPTEDKEWLEKATETWWSEHIWDNLRRTGKVLWDHIQKHPKPDTAPEPQLQYWEGFLHRYFSLVDDFLHNEPEEHILFGKEPIELREKIILGIYLEDPLTGAEMTIEEALKTNIEEIRRQTRAASDEAYSGLPDFYNLKHIVSEWINKVWTNPFTDEAHWLRECSHECTEKARKENPELSDVGFARQKGLRAEIARCTKECIEGKRVEDEKKWWEPEEDPPKKVWDKKMNFQAAPAVPDPERRDRYLPVKGPKGGAS